MAEKVDLRKRKETKEKEYIKSLYKFINNVCIYISNNTYTYKRSNIYINIIINIYMYIYIFIGYRERFYLTYY